MIRSVRTLSIFGGAAGLVCRRAGPARAPRGLRHGVGRLAGPADGLRRPSRSGSCAVSRCGARKPSSQRASSTGYPRAARFASAVARSARFASPRPVARGVDRDRDVVAAFEDRPDQPRELRVGPDFEERPRPDPVHRLDLRDELDRAGELLGQQVDVRRSGSSGYGSPVAFAKTGDRRRARARPRPGVSRKRPADVVDEPAVEGRRDGQRRAVTPRSAKSPAARSDLARSARRARTASGRSCWRSRRRARAPG